MLFIIDGDPELHRAMSTYFLIVVYFLIEMFRFVSYYFINILFLDDFKAICYILQLLERFQHLFL